MTGALDELVGRGVLSPDPLQREAARRLDRIANALQTGLAGALRRVPVQGLYLHGAVGRGKTLLMDMFFAAAPAARKRRVHFHAFMDEVHTAIAAFRQRPVRRGDDADPIAAVARTIVRTTRLLCLDEFQVNDITNAMLLQRLFEKLFAGGVVVVVTSNVAPQHLYEQGLNRQLFLPFIGLLEQHVDVCALDGDVDYRRLKFGGEPVYRFGDGPEVEAAMDRLWAALTDGAAATGETLQLIGRTLTVPRAAMGAARFSFAEICERPLGARDYLRLAQRYEALMIDGVPQFDRTRSDAAKRFILLVDTLYDEGIKLSASFAVPLDALGRDDRTRVEFERCVSRLIEMQSEAYLGAPARSGAVERVN